MIRKGDVITFKAQYRDAGDEAFMFIARSDEEFGRFDVSVIEHRGWQIWPTQVVSAEMVETVNGEVVG